MYHISKMLLIRSEQTLAWQSEFLTNQWEGLDERRDQIMTFWLLTRMTEKMFIPYINK